MFAAAVTGHGDSVVLGADRCNQLQTGKRSLPSCSVRTKQRFAAGGKDTDTSLETNPLSHPVMFPSDDPC